MNILYLIGNGFDVSLGMKTRYADFYDAYCAQAEENVNSKVCELKKIIYHFDTKLAIAPNRGQRLGAIERQVRQNFLRQAGSPDTESSMRERILVGVNSGMFGRVKKSS